MTESQSRYAIVENLNERKSEVQTRLADLQKNKALSEMEYKKNLQNFDKDIVNSENNYVQDHQAWVTNKRLEIDMKQQQFDDEISTLESGINAAEDNYVAKHLDYIKKVETQKGSHNSDFKNFMSIKVMEVKSIQNEITQIDKAIADLKEISKDEAKK